MRVISVRVRARVCVYASLDVLPVIIFGVGNDVSQVTRKFDGPVTAVIRRRDEDLRRRFAIEETRHLIESLHGLHLLVRRRDHRLIFLPLVFDRLRNLEIIMGRGKGEKVLGMTKEGLLKHIGVT